MKLAELRALIEDILRANSMCQNVTVLEAVEYSLSQFRIRIRANLVGGLKFQVHFYCNQSHVDYAYQVFGHFPLVRWDNKEEHPHIKTYPHHHHNLDDDVVDSALVGNPEIDLPRVLEWLVNNWEQIVAANKAGLK